MKFSASSIYFPGGQTKWLIVLLLTLNCLLAACQSRQVQQASSSSLSAPLVPTPAPSASIDPRVTDLNRVVVGGVAPEFALDDMNGNLVKLSDFKGKKNVILVFYRGHF